MTEMAGFVQQQGASNGADGSSRTLAANRMGALVTSSPQAMYDQWLRAGKVFEGHFATEGGLSTIENNTAIDLTEPFIILSAPSSKILVPIKIKVSPAVVWETGDEYILYTSDTEAYSAGGNAMDKVNLAAVSSLDSALGTSALAQAWDGETPLTAAALTNPRIIDAGHFLTGGLHLPYEYNILKGDPMVMLHGAGSIMLMIARTTTTVDTLYSVVWAELDKSELVNS